MKFNLLLLCSLFVLFSCSSESKNEETAGVPERVVSSRIQSILDSAKVEGAVLVYDSEGNTFYSNDFVWAETGFLPASTFKIPNSINALENGIVANDSTVFLWDGKPRYLKSWEEDITFHQAFQRSCVPCYQEIARKTGVEKMRNMLDKIGYPGMVFNGATLDNFWLEGASKISQFQQVDFLSKLVNRELPVTEKTYRIMSKIMFLDQKEGYDLYGKTGWAQPDDSTNIGWFTGYAKTPDNTYYLVTNIRPGDGFNMDDFAKIRMELALKAMHEITKTK
jgi:beta-lactamase class D